MRIPSCSYSHIETVECCCRSLKIKLIGGKRTFPLPPPPRPAIVDCKRSFYSAIGGEDVIAVVGTLDSANYLIFLAVKLVIFSSKQFARPICFDRHLGPIFSVPMDLLCDTWGTKPPWY
jgi:hypothetical protein